MRGFDRVHVLDHRPRYVFVLGEVRSPGAFEIPADTPAVSVIWALAQAGDYSNVAARNDGFIQRENRGKKMKINLKAMASGDEPAAMLEEGDLMVIGASAWKHFLRYVNPSASVGVPGTP